MKRFRSLRWFAIAITLQVFIACAPKAVNGRSTALLTQPGVQALQKTEVVKVLDVVRDVAVDAEAAHVMPTATTRKIVQAHRSALEVIRASNTWKGTVVTSLKELKNNLTADELTIVGAYIDAAISTIQAVIQ